MGPLPLRLFDHPLSPSTSFKAPITTHHISRASRDYGFISLHYLLHSPAGSGTSRQVLLSLLMGNLLACLGLEDNILHDANLYTEGGYTRGLFWVARGLNAHSFLSSRVGFEWVFRTPSAVTLHDGCQPWFPRQARQKHNCRGPRDKTFSFRDGRYNEKLSSDTTGSIRPIRACITPQPHPTRGSPSLPPTAACSG